MEIWLSLLVGLLFGGLVVWLACFDLWREPLRRQLKQVYQQLHQVDQERRQFWGRLRLLARKHEQLERQHEQLTAEKTLVQLTAGRAEGTIQELRTQIQQFQSRINELTDQHSEWQIRQEGTRQKYDLQQMTLTELKTENGFLRHSLTDEGKQKEGLAGQLRDLQERYGRVQGELQVVREQVGRQAELEKNYQHTVIQLGELKAQLTESKLQGQNQQEKLLQLHQQLGVWEQKYHAAEQELVRLPRLQQEVEHLQQQLSLVASQTETLKEALDEAQQDNLEELDGIGPAFARRLKAAGYVSFADLAKATPDQLRQALKLQKWQQVHTDGWITQAKERL